MKFSPKICALVVLLLSGALHAAKPPANLKSIGGRWYVQAGETPVYFYRDADRYVDLFSYHARDSNKDGIPNLRLSHTATHLVIQSQGYPNHPTAIFPNSGNPNRIRVQRFTFRLSLEPKISDRITRVPMGPIGTAINGVVFFNPFEMGGQNAVEGYSEVWLDSCCGHPEQRGVYHYHKYPTCVRSPFSDDAKQHSPIIGFAWDGFPVYGPYEAADSMAMDLKGKAKLDSCNGHQDEQRGYHYHVTPGRFPYIIGGYRGVVESSNFRGRPGTGALVNNTRRGGSRIGQVITSVKPATGTRGQSLTVTFQINPANSRRRPIPNETPTWVQVGPFDGANVKRNSNTITATITIPKDAAVGVPLDCHIEYGTGANPVVIKKNAAFRVSE